MTEPIRILLTDDQALFRAGLRVVLDAQDDMHVVGEASDGAEALGPSGQAGGQADAGPAADARQDGHVLLPLMGVGHDVADDARRRLELVKLLARLGIDGLQVAFERAVEHHVAGRGQGT